jgi:peptidoglycan/LPS O-acetylase OafA/YrhL
MAPHRRLDIQGLRALAVLLVVAFHAGLPMSGGFVGVDVFFVISGFVITGLLVRQWSAQGRIDFGDFYSRRIRRLLPALALVVCVTCALSVLLQPPNGEQQQTAQTAIGAMLLSANIVIPRLSDNYFARSATANPLLHTWSLSVEEQFYLGFPALLFLGLGLTRRRTAGGWPPVIALAAASAVSVVLLLGSTYASRSIVPLSVIGPPFYSSLTRAWEFGAGAMVFLAAATLQRCPPRLLLIGGLAGMAMVLASAVLVNQSTTFPGVVAFAPVFGTALILASGVRQPNLLVRVLSIRPLVWIGDLSYSWYLWHWPAIVFGRLLFPGVARIAIFSAVASLIPAFLSFRFVENPIKTSPHWAGKRVTALAGLTAGTSILLAGMLGFGAREGWGQPWALGAHVVIQRGCDSGEFDPERCSWSTDDANGSVLLLGDSQAWAIADGVISAAASLGYKTTVASHNACPFVLPSAPLDAGGGSPACVARNEMLVQYAREHTPTLVVIANQSAAYASHHADWWRTGLSSAVQRLRATGAGVVIVSIVPLADEQATRTSLWVGPAADRSTPLAAQRDWRRDAITTDRLIEQDHPGVVVFDPATVLCDAERCSVARDGAQLYSDQNHLSRPGALLLEPALRESLTRAAAQAPSPGVR